MIRTLLAFLIITTFVAHTGGAIMVDADNTEHKVPIIPVDAFYIEKKHMDAKACKKRKHADIEARRRKRIKELAASGNIEAQNKIIRARENNRLRCAKYRENKRTLKMFSVLEETTAQNKLDPVKENNKPQYTKHQENREQSDNHLTKQTLKNVPPSVDNTSIAKRVPTPDYLPYIESYDSLEEFFREIFFPEPDEEMPDHRYLNAHANYEGGVHTKTFPIKIFSSILAP